MKDTGRNKRLLATLDGMSVKDSRPYPAPNLACRMV